MRSASLLVATILLWASIVSSQYLPCSNEVPLKHGQSCETLVPKAKGCKQTTVACTDCDRREEARGNGKIACITRRRLLPCNGKPPANGLSCEQIVATEAECLAICPLALGCFPTPETSDNGKIRCNAESLLSTYATRGTEHLKLNDHIKSKSGPTISPFIHHPGDPDVEQLIVVVPLGARITEVKEKDQAIGVMLVVQLIWTDYRLMWDPTEYGGIESITVTRDSIWRPAITPMNLISFSNDDAVKPNVQVLYSGLVTDFTVWNFRVAVNMEFHAFPFDRQTFYITLKSMSKMRGPPHVMTKTESENEWRIVEDFELVPSVPKVFSELTYKVTLKRYPYYWIHLIIIPCFILGFLVMAALTLGADSNSIEALVNIGLAASVATAVVVSTMTDNFPKTERVPSLGSFVQNQFWLIASLLVTLSIRKAIMPKIDSALEKWQKCEPNEELTTSSKFWISIVKILKHRLFLFAIFGIAYITCFGVMMRHADLNFERKASIYDNPLASYSFLSAHKGQ